MKRSSKNYYELLFSDVLFVTPIVRSVKDVMIERMKVAQWFEPNEEKAQVLSGSCALFKSSLKIENEKLIFGEQKLPPSLKLQDMIDVYNDITAEAVLKMYVEDTKPKRKNSRNVKIIL